MKAHLAILPVLATLTGALLLPVVALVSRRAAWPLAVASGLAATAAGVAGLVVVATHGPQRYA
ncbi:MAG: hypothetical protein ACREJG_02330, partial [Candidatus Rokuibacteriota bacterium]